MVWIVVGYRIRATTHGYIAAYCPACDTVQPAVVVDHDRVFTVYWVPIGEHTPFRTARCVACKTAVRHAAAELFGAEPSPGTIEGLIAATNPRVVQRVAETQVLGEAAAAGEATDEERQRFVERVFGDVTPAIEARRRLGGFDRASLIGVAVAALCTVAFPVLGCFARQWWFVVGLLAAAPVWAWTIYLFGTVGQRYAKRHILPMLAARLAPIDPTDAELQAGLDEAWSVSGPAAKCLSPRRVRRAIARRR